MSGNTITGYDVRVDAELGETKRASASRSPSPAFSARQYVNTRRSCGTPCTRRGGVSSGCIQSATSRSGNRTTGPLAVISGTTSTSRLRFGSIGWRCTSLAETISISPRSSAEPANRTSRPRAPPPRLRKQNAGKCVTRPRGICGNARFRITFCRWTSSTRSFGGPMICPGAWVAFNRSNTASARRDPPPSRVSASMSRSVGKSMPNNALSWGKCSSTNVVRFANALGISSVDCLGTSTHCQGSSAPLLRPPCSISS